MKTNRRCSPGWKFFSIGVLTRIWKNKFQIWWSRAAQKLLIESPNPKVTPFRSRFKFLKQYFYRSQLNRFEIWSHIIDFFLFSSNFIKKRNKVWLWCNSSQSWFSVHVYYLVRWAEKIVCQTGQGRLSPRKLAFQVHRAFSNSSSLVQIKKKHSLWKYFIKILALPFIYRKFRFEINIYWSWDFLVFYI